MKGDCSAEQAWSEWMRAALAGDAVAYRRLLVAITPHVRRIARGIVGRRGDGAADVENVVQETLLAIRLKGSTWDPARPFLQACETLAKVSAKLNVQRLPAALRDEHDVIFAVPSRVA